MTAPVLAADVDELVREFVRPGMHLHFAATLSRPNALIYAVARQFQGSGDLTVSTTAIHSSAHALALSGAVRHAITCFLGDTYPTPRPNPIYRRLAEGQPFTVEPWSLLSYTQRLMAAATGVPYAITASLAGSDLAAGKPALHVAPDPADPDREVILLEPLRPDLTLVHGVCADRRGNVVMCAPLGEGGWAAYAARHGVLASVERIVPDEVIDALPGRVVIPGQRVAGLAVAELGAHPQSLRTDGIAGVAGYRDDYDFMTEIVRRCAEPDRGAAWFREWVAEPGGHPGYLRRLGADRRASLGRPKPVEPRPATAVSDQERVIVLAARAIAEHVRAGRYDTVLAGIGTSHMAAWLAAALLRLEGQGVKVAAELGFYGLNPYPGDVFLFSQLHADRSEQLSAIPEVLGGLVAANPRCLGVLAAAEIDEAGDINTTMLPDGRWVTGSGGANDIASTADCLVVATASARRYVPKVAYLTSPGRRVRQVVSQFGRFERGSSDEPFHLATWLPTDGVGPGQRVAELTRWPARTDSAVREDDITDKELALLRDLDPEGHYR